jgi:type III secretion system FlhB-like substrate exporter
LKNKKTYDSYNSSKNPYKSKKTNEKNDNTNKKNVILGYSNKKPQKETIIKNDKINEEKNKAKLFSMERNFQKNDPLFNDEPLLITPITDSDFQKGIEIFSNIKDNNKNIIELFGDKEINLDKIFEFLSIMDITQLKRVSKFFKTKALNYFVKNLTETKNKLIAIRNEITNISEQKNLTDMKFSQETESSIKLLNENIMVKFFQESKPPRDDILFIFEVFFQLINKPMKDANNNKKVFWEKCSLYFLNEGNGKIGDMLINIVKNNKIDISEDNLYKIYKLVKDKLDIIVPSHFNKICSTTPLITLYIKDILNFLGISTDENDIKQNGYWTYTNIINSIEKKINKIKKFE